MKYPDRALASRNAFFGLTFAFALLACLVAGAAQSTQANTESYTFSRFIRPASSNGGASKDATPLNAPSGIAVDAAGNVYVADTDNHAIRKVTPTGLLTTLPGAAGVGASGSFSHPKGVAVDFSGNVLVADAVNQAIREITPAGAVSTRAGQLGVIGRADGLGNAARFNYPYDVASDRSGSIYVADTFNSTIRKITRAGVVSTLAGSAGEVGATDGAGPLARFNFPSGLAVGSSGDVYVADTGNSVIRKITSAGVVSTVAGSAGVIGRADGRGSEAQFNHPRGLTVDSAGYIYVADSLNKSLRKISPSGVVTTLRPAESTGNSKQGGETTFQTPESVATDAKGNLYVADSAANTIWIGRSVASVASASADLDSLAQPQDGPDGTPKVNFINGKTVTEGQSAHFQSAASGTQPLTYTWRKNDVNIPDAPDTDGYDTPPTTLADSGALFSVVVSNSVGSTASNEAVLTVNPAGSPTPTLSPGRVETYGTAPDGATLMWTVYQPAGNGPWPAIIMIHGGGFTKGDMTSSPEMVTTAHDLQAAGYLAVSVQYRLAPPGTILNQTSSGQAPEQYDDVKQATRTLRADPRFNGHLGAIGGSAGGAHCAWLAVDHSETPLWSGNDRPDCAVCLSGAYDFLDYRTDEHNAIVGFTTSVTAYCGTPNNTTPNDTDRAILQANSPTTLVDDLTRPMLLVTSVDDTMPPEQVGDMTAALDAAFVGKPTIYDTATVPGSLHAWANWPVTIAGTETVKSRALGFFAAHLLTSGLPTPTPTVSPTGTPTPTAAPSGTPTPTPTGSPRLGNISTRLSVGTGDNVLIGGFIVQGDAPKKVLIRGLGPSLGSQVAGALADPTVELFDAAGKSLASNDNWMSSPNKGGISATGIPPKNPKESAIIQVLPLGTYTAVLKGVNGGTGVGLIEIYDLGTTEPTRLANISTRGAVGTGDDVMIGGVLILGDAPEKVLVRALGPELPVNGMLANPTLSLYDGNGSLIRANDDWKNVQKAEIIATGAAPTNDLEAALIATLDPGAYTAVVQGKDGTTGVALVEAYQISE